MIEIQLSPPKSLSLSLSKTNKMFYSWIVKRLLTFRVSNVKFWKIRLRRRYILRFLSTTDDTNPFESSQEALSISLKDQQNFLSLVCKTTINIPRQQCKILEDQNSSALYSEISLYGRRWRFIWVISIVSLEDQTKCFLAKGSCEFFPICWHLSLLRTSAEWSLISRTPNLIVLNIFLLL